MGKSARTAETTQDTTGQLDSIQNQNQIRQLNENQQIDQTSQTTGTQTGTTDQLVQSLSDILNRSSAVETGTGTSTVDSTTGGLAAAQPGIQQILDQVAQLSGRALAPTDPTTLQAAAGFEQAAGGAGTGILNPAGTFANQGLQSGGVGLDTLSQFAQGNFGGGQPSPAFAGIPGGGRGRAPGGRVVDPNFQQGDNFGQVDPALLTGAPQAGGGGQGGFSSALGMTAEQARALQGGNQFAQGFGGGATAPSGASVPPGGSNLDQVIANRQLDTSDVIRRMTAAAGRSGSPAETGILGRELGKIGLEAQLGERRTDLDRQLAAAGQLPGEARGIFGQLLPFQQAQTFGAGALQQAGDIRQQAAQRELDDPLAQIQRQQDVVFPASGLGQEQQATTQDINQLISDAISQQTGQDTTQSQTVTQQISDLIKQLTGTTTGQTTENITLENILSQLTSGQAQGTQTKSLADTALGFVNAASGFIPGSKGAVPIKQ